MYKCNVDAGWLAYLVNKLLRSLNQAARFPYNAVPPAGGLEGIVAPETSKPMTCAPRKYSKALDCLIGSIVFQSNQNLPHICMFSPADLEQVPGTVS